ncbi:MAG: hypothetical protein QM538_00690 [Methylacidiphilales bacterium]|nr:hypothetical protein [Candidatus Methylacidiphilales bacterium]
MKHLFTIFCLLLAVNANSMDITISYEESFLSKEYQYTEPVPGIDFSILLYDKVKRFQSAVFQIGLIYKQTKPILGQLNQTINILNFGVGYSWNIPLSRTVNPNIFLMTNYQINQATNQIKINPDYFYAINRLNKITRSDFNIQVGVIIYGDSFNASGLVLIFKYQVHLFNRAKGLSFGIGYSTN